MNTVKKPLAPYVTVFAGDVQFMAGDAYAHRGIETGGALYGLWSHSGRPVIMLATPAGPGACRETAHFAVNPEYVTWVNKELQKMFGIQYLGNHHDHHRLGMNHPSSGDVGQIHRLAVRYNIPRMVQIVLTHEDGMISAPGSDGCCNIGRKASSSLHKPVCVDQGVGLCNEAGSAASVECSRIRINVFIYTEASKGGTYTRCPLKVLPYPNPIRTVLADSKILRVTGGDHFEDFPLERIVYDELEPVGESGNAGQTVPSVLVNQLDELPDEIARQVEIYTDKGLILVSLPLPNDYRVCVTYHVERSLPRINSVHCVRPHTKVPVDITNEILTHNYASLSLIRQRAEEKISADKRKRVF